MDYLLQKPLWTLEQMIDTQKITKADPISIVLEKRGIELAPDGTARLKARCPLPDHDENTPSFTAYLKDERFHCFGFGKSGDVITLVQELDGISFREACRNLGASLGEHAEDVRYDAPFEALISESAAKWKGSTLHRHGGECHLRSVPAARHPLTPSPYNPK